MEFLKKTIVCCIIALFIIFLMPCAGQTSSSVYYYLPFLSTNSAVVTYCIASNTSTYNVTTMTFTVMASSHAEASQTAQSFSTTLNLAKGRTILFSFNEQKVYVDSTSAIDISSYTGTNSNYGATLKFLSTTDSSINCKNILLACFQGTTTPKRNIVGYLCEDDSTSGPGSNFNLIGY
ncbi:MAG: hypothetical protein H7844_09475 [Nitrospirae bacterium YQR-1]